MKILPVNTLEEGMLLKCLVISSAPKWASSQPLRRVPNKEVLYQVSRDGVEVLWELIFNVYDLLEGLPLLTCLERKVPAYHLIDDHAQGP